MEDRMMGMEVTGGKSPFLQENSSSVRPLIMKLPILLFLLSAVSLFAVEPWPGVPFTEVRAYAWE
jgi:hypothetical protein